MGLAWMHKLLQYIVVHIRQETTLWGIEDLARNLPAILDCCRGDVVLYVELFFREAWPGSDDLLSGKPDIRDSDVIELFGESRSYSSLRSVRSIS
jgi:hypothetical protein